eukprot:6177957-Pleurochrysis_carterae.AAC.1
MYEIKIVLYDQGRPNQRTKAASLEPGAVLEAECREGREVKEHKSENTDVAEAAEAQTTAIAGTLWERQRHEARSRGGSLSHLALRLATSSARLPDEQFSRRDGLGRFRTQRLVRTQQQHATIARSNSTQQQHARANSSTDSTTAWSVKPQLPPKSYDDAGRFARCNGNIRPTGVQNE